MLQSHVSIAQWTLDVVGTVKKEETKKRMEGAVITIKRNGSVWKTLNPPANGKFEAALTPNAVYIIEFSKPGHVTKRMQLSTKNVPEEDSKYGFEFPLEMNLFEKVDGLDVSILNKPIAKIEFNPETGYMDYDPVYTKLIKKELDRLKEELSDRLKSEAENRKVNQKAYDAAIVSADKAYNAGKWVEAKPYYEKAAGIFSDESYPEFQLGDISDKLAGLEASNKKYNSSITKADAALKAREYDKAIASYEMASGYKEEEQYPKDKIKEVKSIQANAKKADKEYKDAIASGDQSMLSRDYDAAKDKFEKALELKDYEEYPKGKLIEIETILAEQVAKEKDYTNAITEADAALSAKQYDKAVAAYQKALGIKPIETYPLGKIEEAKRLKAEEKQLEERFNKFIANADAAFSTKDYEIAKSDYEKASALKSEEKYPKDKLLEIKVLTDAAAKLDIEYANLIKEGDNTLASKNYESSKIAFEKAAGLKSEEQYPKDKLTEITAAIEEIAKDEADKKVKEEEYQKIITAADEFFIAKKYEEAKGKFSEAVSLKSVEKYPKDKLIEIDVLIAALAKKEAEMKAKEEAYKKLIMQADGMLSAKDYENSKSKYNAALGIKSEEKYPKDKIKLIDETMALLDKEEADNKQKEEKYAALIAEGDNLLGSKKYEEAKVKFTESLTVKTGEQYPTDKLKGIENALAEIARKKAEEEAAQMAGAERDDKYTAAIIAADISFNSQKYDAAKLKYNEATGIKSEEQYPKDKLNEIKAALAEIARKKAEEQASQMAGVEKDKKYQEAITLADNAFGFENYDQAKIKFNEALAIKPDEKYPKDKLRAVEEALSALAKKNEDIALAAESARKKKEYFEAIIAEADAELSAKKYEEATEKYKQALGVIPGEKYPTDKIKEIADILAKIEAEKDNVNTANAELEKKYNDLISSADKSFGTKKYDESKSDYQSALGLKSSESYPKTQIVEIERLLKEIAAKENEISLTANAQKQKEADFNALIAQADNDFSAKSYKTARSNYERALGLMPDKNYPKEKIDEIKKVLADLAAKDKDSKAALLAKKGKRKEYEKLIYDGDRSMKLKEYTNAKVIFTDALALYSDEKYPKDKLAQIAAKLEELSKPKEILVSKGTMIGGRAKINGDKEKEIEAKMAALMGKSFIHKDDKLRSDKDAFKNQEEIRISGGIERTKIAKEELSTSEDGNIAIAEIGNEFHKENSEMLDASSELFHKAEMNRIKKADKRRNESDQKLEIYAKQQPEIFKQQEALSEGKSEAHYIYVDNLNEGELIIIEKGDKLRAENRIDIEKITAEDTKQREASQKRAEDMTIDFKPYKEELAKGEDILISASIERTEENTKKIKEVSESLLEMKKEKVNHYKLNVIDLTDFKARIDMLEANNIEEADGFRENNQRINDKYVSDIKKNVERLNQNYYTNLVDVKAYKKEVATNELENQKEADKQRIAANREVVKAMENLNRVDQSNEKRYTNFKAKLDLEKENNATFWSDLQRLEQQKLLLASAKLEGFYMGEKRLAENDELSAKYPQGITEETVESGNSVVIRRTKVTDKQADVYERVFYTWGGTYFYKNGVSITQSLWDKESID